MNIGSGVDDAPDGASAARRASEEAGESLTGTVDLALVFASADHVGSLGGCVDAVREVLDPRHIIGGIAQGVVGPGTEIEAGPAVAVWAAEMPGARFSPFRSWTVQRPEGGVVVAGWPDAGPDDLSIVLADPFTYPMGDVARRVSASGRHRIIGGLVTAGRGGTELAIQDGVHGDGAVGVVISGAAIDTVVSQGCRPVGEPFVVTAAEGNVILELGGRLATERLTELFETAGDEDRRLIETGLHIGLVADEYRDDFVAGDFLIRGVLGADAERGAIAIGERVEPGRTVQFQVRDAASAHRDLTGRLDADPRVAGTLLFTCNGRGRAFFGLPNHDVEAVTAGLGQSRIAGAFCAGEVGPVGAEAFVHGFTASLAVFRDA